jgi:hypothetical protein
MLVITDDDPAFVKAADAQAERGESLSCNCHVDINLA